MRFYAVRKSFDHEGAVFHHQSVQSVMKWDGRPKSGDWQPIEFELTTVGAGRRLLETDFPAAIVNRFILSERATRILADEFLANGELLPMIAGGDRYFAFNPLVQVDALDPAQTWYWPSQDYHDRLVETPAFRPEAVAGRHLVRLPQPSMSPFYVDGSFKRRVERAGLRGLTFRLVWSDDPAVCIRPVFGSSGDFWRAWEAAEAARQGDTSRGEYGDGGEGERP